MQSLKTESHLIRLTKKFFTLSLTLIASLRCWSGSIECIAMQMHHINGTSINGHPQWHWLEHPSNGHHANLFILCGCLRGSAGLNPVIHQCLPGLGHCIFFLCIYTHTYTTYLAIYFVQIQVIAHWMQYAMQNDL